MGCSAECAWARNCGRDRGDNGSVLFLPPPVRSLGIPALATLLLLAGCGSGDEQQSRDEMLPQDAQPTVSVDLVTVDGLGPVLADQDGYVLYMFPPDASSRVSCTGPCAGSWPPLSVTPDGTTAAGAGVSSELLGYLPDPNTGGDVVTYAGYPLYRYAGDLDPGTANGQALFLNGGPWYVVDAAGQVLTTDLPGAA